MNVSVISPIHNHLIKEFSYNPDEINHFAMSRLVGLGLTLINNNELEDQNLDSEFILKSFSLKDHKELLSNNIESSKDLNLGNIKTKDKIGSKTKSEEKKKELPPLPNIEESKDIKNEIKKGDKINKETDKTENRKNKSFKMDTSFLKND